MSSGSNDFRLDRYIQTSGKYRSPQIYRALKLSGDYKTSKVDNNMACICDCVIYQASKEECSFHNVDPNPECTCNKMDIGITTCKCDGHCFMHCWNDGD